MVYGRPCSACPVSSKNSGPKVPRGVHDVVPEESGLFLRIEGVVMQKEAKGAALLLFDHSDDLGDEAVLGAEIVDQHAVAGAELCGKLTQAQVADPAARREPESVLDEPGPGSAVFGFTRSCG